MASLEVKNKDGKVVGKHEVGGALKEAKSTPSLLHKAVVAEEANSRQGTQSAKTRSETRGGGRKPYRQKKTGNARQGTIRAPHYAHGGMALAVKPRDYEKKLNRRERRAAILGALSERMDSGDVTVIDAIAIAQAKTKDASAMLKAMGVDKVRRVLVVLAQYDEPTFKSFRNLPNVEVRTAPAKAGSETKTSGFSARDILVAHKILVAKDALATIEEVWN